VNTLHKGDNVIIIKLKLIELFIYIWICLHVILGSYDAQTFFMHVNIGLSPHSRILS
jgi:hypothetical protein